MSISSLYGYSWLRRRLLGRRGLHRWRSYSTLRGPRLTLFAALQCGRHALRRWRSQAEWQRGLEWRRRTWHNIACFRGDSTRLIKALRLWWLDSRSCAKPVGGRPAMILNSDVRLKIQRWQRHARCRALMKRGAMAMRDHESRRAVNAWCAVCTRALRTRELLRRVSMGALFGATAMWRDGARRWSQRMRRRRLGVHRWIGNACALALVRWRHTVAIRSLPHRALEAWRRMGRARALRTWVAFAALDENTLLLYMATAAWSNRVLARSLHAWVEAQRRLWRRAVRSWRARALRMAFPRWDAAVRWSGPRRAQTAWLCRRRASSRIIRCLHRWYAHVQASKRTLREMWMMEQLNDRIKEEIGFTKRMMHQWELKQWQSTSLSPVSPARSPHATARIPIEAREDVWEYPTPRSPSIVPCPSAAWSETPRNPFKTPAWLVDTPSGSVDIGGLRFL